MKASVVAANFPVPVVAEEGQLTRAEADFAEEQVHIPVVVVVAEVRLLGGASGQGLAEGKISGAIVTEDERRCPCTTH